MAEVLGDTTAQTCQSATSVIPTCRTPYEKLLQNFKQANRCYVAASNDFQDCEARVKLQA